MPDQTEKSRFCLTDISKLRYIQSSSFLLWRGFPILSSGERRISLMVHPCVREAGFDIGKGETQKMTAVGRPLWAVFSSAEP